MSIIFSRVDSRGLHGQVILKWLNEPQYKADACLIIDDEIAGNDALSLVYKNAAPEGIKVYIFTEEQALTKLPQAVNSTKGAKYILLVRSILVLQRLFEKGLDGSFMNKTGLVMGPSLNETGSYHLVGAWHYKNNEFQAMDSLESRGISIRFQLLPQDKPLYWKDLRKKLG